MLRQCQAADAAEMCDIINRATEAYAGVIPQDCYHQPYMSLDELSAEMRRVQFYAWEEARALLGVMGIEPVGDVTLIRHAYVLPEHQRCGIASALLGHLKTVAASRRLLVGTWAAAWWAIKFYEKHGFRLLPGSELLRVYWQIPERQVAASVVLELKA